MKIGISLHGAHSDVELRSLYRWLKVERGELAAAGLILRAPGSSAELPPPDEMGGGTFDVVQLVVNAIPAWGALMLSISTWSKAHGSRSSLTVERDGTKITFTGADLEDVPSLLAALREEERSENRENAE